MIINNKIVLEKKVDKSLLLSLLTILLFPLFPTVFGNNSFHVIPFAIFFSFLILYKRNGNRIFMPKNNSTHIVISFFFISFLLLSISLFNDIHFQNTSLSYFLGVIKPLYLFLFFIVGFTNKINDFKIVYTFTTFFEIAIILCFCYALFEIIFIEEFKNLIYFLYKRQERLVLIDKATGWFGVTYYLAYFCLLLFFYSFFMLSKSFNFKYLFLTLFAFVPLVLSQSRTVIIAFLFGFIIIPFLRISNKNKIIYLLYLFFSIVTITLYIIYFDFIYDNFRYAYSGIARLTEGIDLNDEGSVQTRYKQFLWAFDNNTYKVIGFGLGREEGLALESIYASYMYRFGIIYLLIYLFIIYKFYQISSKLALLFKNNNILYSFFSASSIFYITSPISLLASPSHEMPKIAFIVFIMSGIVYRFNYKYLNSNFEKA
jgi:hypothetical protein